MPDETPTPAPSAKVLHIADRKRAFAEEIRHFTITGKTSKVVAEKEEAAARVEVAKALLATLEKL